MVEGNQHYVVPNTYMAVSSSIQGSRIDIDKWLKSKPEGDNSITY